MTLGDAKSELECAKDTSEKSSRKCFAVVHPMLVQA